MTVDGSGAPPLAAFVEVMRNYGVDTTVEAITRKYAFADGDAASPPLEAIAADLGLQARWIKLRWSQLSNLRPVLPALIRLSDGSALVLSAVVEDKASGIVLHVGDPLAGDQAHAMLDREQLSPIWNGEILLVKKSGVADDLEQSFGIGWLLRQVAKEKVLFRDISLASFLNTIFVLAPPFIVMIVIDRVLVNHSATTLVVIAIVLVTMVVFEMVLFFLRRVFMEVAACRIDGRLQLYVMERLLRLPMDFFERTPVGNTAAKLSKMWQIRSFLTGQAFTTLLDLVTLVGLIPALFILEWKLAFWVLALGVLIFVVVVSFLRPLSELLKKVIFAENIKSAYLIETLQGMKTIKSLALEGRRRRGWDERVAVAISARQAWGKAANYPQTMVIPLQRFMYSGSILIGAAMALSVKNTMNPGALIAFGMVAMRTAAPLVQLAKLLETLGEVRSAVAEVASVMNVPAEESRGESGLRLQIFGEIRFDNVRFRYAPGAPIALDGASFEIRAGTIFGIMGRSGSGKTTITRLLQGLNKGYEGAIKIDGMDLREIDLHHLRTSIGVVPQENFLFSGTVRENIGMARSSATFAQIVRAAQLAGAEEFIEKMPRGYDTVLQEGATNLSGGQRQRLALARALIIDPAVLILDEATSALDAESEAIINANLVRIARDRTIICVSHRLSMLVPADAILVMDAGRAYDIGRHEELLHRCDIYKHMWYQQNRHLESSANVRPVLARA